MYPCELGADEIDAVITLGWLPEGAEADRNKVGVAVSEMLRELARWLRNCPKLLDRIRK